MHWDDDTHLRYRVRYVREEASGCFTQTWAVHTVFEGTRLISDTLCFTEGTEAAPTPTIAVELSNRDIEIRRRSPDKSWEFILAQTSTPDASLPKMGDDDPASEASLYQGWLVNVSRGEAHAIFYTAEIFGYLWAPDSRRLIVVGDTCYGGGPDVVLGSGLYTIDVQNHTLHTISSDYVTGCEGSLGYAVAPDGQHVIYEPGIVSSMDGTHQVDVCGERESARSYTWSSDGQYAYAACAQETDTLRRYDTWAGKHAVVVDGRDVRFRAIRMALSPNQKHLAFIWGTSTFNPLQPYDEGIWILDLSQFAEGRGEK
jgi:hypothetical protein